MRRHGSACGHRGCNGELRSTGDDPLLPSFLTRLECDRCGEWWIYDESAGESEIDR